MSRYKHHPFLYSVSARSLADLFIMVVSHELVNHYRCKPEVKACELSFVLIKLTQMDPFIRLNRRFDHISELVSILKKNNNNNKTVVLASEAFKQVNTTSKLDSIQESR